MSPDQSFMPQSLPEAIKSPMAQSSGPLPDGLALSADDFLGGRITLLQPKKGHHRSGTDAVLLAACTPARSGDLVVDLGSGIGAAGLCVAARIEGLRLLSVEIEPDVACIARANMDKAGAACRLAAGTVLCTDVALRGAARLGAGLSENMADHVIANPPYYHPGKFQTSPNAARATAHMLTGEGMEPWFRTAVSILKKGGSFTLIQRADMLPELLRLMEGRFGGITIQPFAPREGEPAHRIVIQGHKQSRAPLRLLPAIALHDKGTDIPAARIEAVHRHGAAIDLG